MDRVERAARAKHRMLEKWFERRFGRKPEYDRLYFADWERRQRNGQTWLYMDSESRRVWVSLFGDVKP